MWKRIKNKIYQKVKGMSNEELSLEANIKMEMKGDKNASGLVDRPINHCSLIETGNDEILHPRFY